jgi:choline dehydrogenase-like flavoprotein
MAAAYERIVGLDEATISSDAALADYARANVGTYCHALGTVPMGADGDTSAVLDQRCRVRGVMEFRWWMQRFFRSCPASSGT